MTVNDKPAYSGDIVLAGTVATDTHQQERIMVRIILRVEGGLVTGSIGTGRGSAYWEDPEPEFDLEPFHGEELGPGAGVRSFRIVMDRGVLSCHLFTAAEFFLDVGRAGGWLYEKPGERRVALCHPLKS